MSKPQKVEIVDFPETLIAIMEHRDSPKLLGSTIQKFIKWRKLKGLSPDKSKTFNLVYDDISITPDEEYRFDVGCSIEKKLDDRQYGIVNKIIPGGKCALVRHIGSDDTIGEVVNYLYAEWLPDSDFVIRDFPIVFERVRFFPEVPEKEMVTDIYLPIE